MMSAPTTSPITIQDPTKVPSAASSAEPEPTMNAPTPHPTVPSREAAIAAYINCLTFSDDSIVYPPSSESAEELALEWLIEVDPLQLTTDTASERFRLTQRYALVTLWFSTGGPSSWCVGCIDGWLIDTEECTWRGLTCSEMDLGGGVGLQNVVTEFDFLHNGMQGPIAPDIALLSSVTLVYFRSNLLNGRLPASIGTMDKLQRFDVAFNQLTGGIPLSFASLTSLTSFYLSGNSFNAFLPAFVGQWTSLTDFGIRSNGFWSALPSTIGQWSSLESFSIQNNAFGGTLPDSIGQWTGLESFDISNNTFTGELPDAIGQWSSLFEFSVQNNKFRGQIPESVTNWAVVNAVHLHNNEFSGAVPSELCGLPSLSTMTADCAEVTCRCCTACCPDEGNFQCT
jgi:hypothetical protein